MKVKLLLSILDGVVLMDEKKVINVVEFNFFLSILNIFYSIQNYCEKKKKKTVLYEYKKLK